MVRILRFVLKRGMMGAFYTVSSSEMKAPRSAVFCWDGGLSFIRHEGEGVGNTAQYPLIVFHELRWPEGKHRHYHAVVVQHCKSPPLDSPFTVSGRVGDD